MEIQNAEQIAGNWKAGVPALISSPENELKEFWKVEKSFTDSINGSKIKNSDRPFELATAAVETCAKVLQPKRASPGTDPTATFDWCLVC